MNNRRSVCVFLGSSKGQGDMYIEGVKKLAKEIVNHKITLIYGGGKLGLMGILADEVIYYGGEVIGIITKNLLKEEGHQGLTKLHVVETMQERKLLMAQLSDGCIALPGGLGTLEEIFEFWNASKLSLFKKPIVLFNINNYYNKLFDFILFSQDQGFISSDSLKLVEFKTDPKDIINYIFSNKNNNYITENKAAMRLFI